MLTITYTISTIELVYTDPVDKYSIEINKIKKVRQKGDSVFLFFTDGSTTEIVYSDVDSPAYANVGELYDAILAAVLAGSSAVEVAAIIAAIEAEAAGLVASANHFSPDDFSAAYTSSATITLSGLALSLTSEQLKYISVISSAGVVTWYFQGVNGVVLTISSNVITITGVTDPFATGDIYEIGVRAQDKAYDPSTQSDKITVLNPEHAHYTAVEHPVDEVNLAIASYYQVIDMEGFRSAAIQLLGSGGVTFTAYMTLSEDAPDDDETDTQWEDVTLDLFGAATIVDTGAIGFIETLRMPKKILIKYVTSDATNAVDIWQRRY